MFERQHTWRRAMFFSFSISLCICVDIFQHSVPLPFLPQALSAQGHTTMEIASVMGGYYWMGFAGGLILTLICFYRVLYDKEVRQPTWSDMRSHVWKLIGGLTFGACTLLAEAANPNWLPDITVHLYCRLLQGFVGAFLFFYSYLLSVKLFEGQQQVFALTCASIALNVAEVFGPCVGAYIYTAYGPSAPYIFLGVLSGINNLLLFITLKMLPGGDAESIADEEEQRRLVPAQTRSVEEGKKMLGQVFRDPIMWRAVLVIAPAAAVKSCFESILPFFGDQHHYSEIHIGWFFMVVAVAYIISSVGIGYKWLELGEGTRLVIITIALGTLACSAGCILTSYGTNFRVAEFGVVDVTRHEAFYMCLIMYGVSLGLTHTPAAFLLGMAVDKYEDAALQDSVNGIYNTMWEFGGSLGFVLSGLASQHDWRQEQQILAVTGAGVAIATVLFVLTSERVTDKVKGYLSPSMEKAKLHP